MRGERFGGDGGDSGDGGDGGMGVGRLFVCVFLAPSAAPYLGFL